MSRLRQISGSRGRRRRSRRWRATPLTRTQLVSQRPRRGRSPLLREQVHKEKGVMHSIATQAQADTELAQNVVAIFHASFHPTKGNTIDWSSTQDDSIDLDGVEFCVLPSGLHLVERDIIYFSHGKHTGLAVFRRRPTSHKSHRGFRLSSLGILLQDAPRPRPWLHLQALRELADQIYDEADRRESDGAEDLLKLDGSAALGDLRDADFVPAQKWFERRRAEAEKTSFGSWSGWSDELDGCYTSKNTPTHHLPHLLRILGLSSLTLYKFVLARRRILIFTLPPVEVAGVLAWLASDLCREHHMAPRNQALGTLTPSLLSSSERPSDASDTSSHSPNVLGMVTLNDLQRLERESATGRGWIACTTDALFMERPQYYDLIIDLTTSTPYKSSRPALHQSKCTPASPNGKKKGSYKLETVRFTWSDVKLWTELDRVLKLDSSENSRHTHGGACCLPPDALPHPSSGPSPSSSSSMAAVWSDAFRVYDDVCLLCATLWMGLGTWRSNSRQSFTSGGRVGSGGGWGAARTPGDDDWSLEGTHVRAVGQGIQGGKAKGDKGKEKGDIKVRTRGQGIEGKPIAKSNSSHSRKASSSSTFKASTSTRTYIESVDEGSSTVQQLTAEEREEMRLQNVQTTLALLQTFHANTIFWLSRLREILPPPSSVSSPGPGVRSLPSSQNADDRTVEEVTITARDLLSLELGVVSELDARFIEWLAEAEDCRASSSSKRRIVVKRGWGELLGIVFGFR